MLMQQLKLFNKSITSGKAFKVRRACALRTHEEKMEMVREKYPFFALDVILKKARQRFPSYLSALAVEMVVADALLDYTPTEFRSDVKKDNWKHLQNPFYTECKKIVEAIVKEIGCMTER